MEADPRFKGYKSYIQTAIVKYIESQGARVLPILYDELDSETEWKLRTQVNGILMPGAEGNFGNYLVKGKFVFDMVTKIN